MYEYGCFAAFWSNFELAIEVGIWLYSGRAAKENCRLVNPKTAGQKKVMLENLLLDKGLKEANDALQEVFSVADRNGWIHGHILNPNQDFSRLT
jgi:nicotinamide mononucleotide adenylyltransferase